MLYRIRRPAYLYADENSDTVLTTIPEGTLCLLVESHNLAAGIEYDTVLYDGQVGYVCCSLGDRVESE